MSNDKKAFVFDTNFIVQVGKLDEVIENLKDNYTVYVTQVSIDERIAQQCRELKEDFDELEKCKQKFIHFAEINFKKTYEEEREFYHIALQEKYEKEFGDHIIPFSRDGKTFSAVIERANKKLPPFSNAKNASDKGFKDYLLWLSMMEYFKANGESMVVFVTDDNSAFRNHTEFLSNEFREITGKNIDFKTNAFYKELMSLGNVVKENKEKEILPDVSQFREKIRDVLLDLCGGYEENYFGEPYWEKTFTSNQRVDGAYMKVIFEGLCEDIKKHIFDTYVNAEDILDLDGRLTNGSIMISMMSIESAHRLHNEVKEKYPDYIEQFYFTAAEIFNRNYVEPPAEEDDDLPF
ncbi:MAG: DUF4935 domain-containing protein [Clostridia bacterium]|nr:DUF4935 domain-containing protein [Clostridia bacterium]